MYCYGLYTSLTLALFWGQFPICSRAAGLYGSPEEMLFFLVIRSLSLIKMICSLVFMTFDLVENKGTS